MSSEAFLAVRNRSGVTRVALQSILYVMRVRRKLCVVCNEEKYEYYESMDNIAPLFGEGFFRVYDGCFVNLELIDKVTGETVFFRGGERLILSRDAAVRCKQRFYVYLKTGERVFAGERREKRLPEIKDTLDKSGRDQYNL